MNSKFNIDHRKKWETLISVRAFSRIHIDFFYFAHHTFLLTVDSYTKWVELDWMKNGTDCGKVLRKLVAIFARFGLPDVLVSDGGPPFNASAFVSFLKKQGINVLKSPPYNPSSNGQAERLVRTVKDVLKKFLLDPELTHLELEDQINLFLINYRNNCLTIEGNFPSQLMLSYKPKTILDLLNPKFQYKNHLSQEIVHEKKCDKQVPNKKQSFPTDDDPSKEGQVIPKNVSDPFEHLTEGDELWYRNHNPHNPAKWLKASFIKRCSRNTFQVQIGSVPTRAHRVQLRLIRAQAEPKPIIRWGSQQLQSVSRASSEEFLGFPESEMQGRKRKRAIEDMPSEVDMSPELAPRRSKRLKRKIVNKDYVYLKF